jgi:Tol biopolymer transport system component
MRYLCGLLLCCGLTIAGCSSNNTVECNFTPQVTADGREVIYRQDICGPAECNWHSCWRPILDSHLLVHDVETRATSQLSLWVVGGGFDVSGNGEVIAYYGWEEEDEMPLLEIYDRGSGNTTRVDVTEFGIFGSPSSPRISGDGQVVAFTIHWGLSWEGEYAIHLYDRATEQIERGTPQPGTDWPSLSNDGRFLAYQMRSDFSAHETAIYVLDRANGQSTLVSGNSDGEPANTYSFDPVISGDGRFVVFRSSTTNPACPDEAEVYLHDRETGTTSLLSTAADSGEPSGTGCTLPSPYGPSGSAHAISTDGQFVAYESDAESIVPVDGQASVPAYNVYRYDAGIDRTTRVSVNSLGEPANGLGLGSMYPSVSNDGRFVAFITTSTNLDPDDADSESDVYLHDVSSGETRWVSRR